LRAKPVTIAASDLLPGRRLLNVGSMGSGLGRGASGVAARAQGNETARGARASFVLRRIWFAPLLPASLLLAVLTSVTVATALASFGARALSAAADKRLASAPGTALQVSGQIGGGTASADTPVIRAAIRSALGQVPFTMATGRWSDEFALPGRPGGTQVPLIQAALLAGVRAHAELVAGTWPGRQLPGQPIGVVLPVATARTLGFTAGEVLDLRDNLTGLPARFQVTGLFRARDPAARYWGLSLLGTSGQLVRGTFITYGPMLVDPSAFSAGGLTVGDASWLIAVDTARIPPGGISELGSRLDAAVTALRTRQGLGGLEVTTDLPQVLSALGSGLVVSRSLLLVGSLQLILLATAAAALAARLLAGQREGENALLSARGVARAQLALASLAEAALLAVAAAAAGAVLGSYLANLLMSVNGLTAGSGYGLAAVARQGLADGAWWPAAALPVLAIIVVMWPAVRPSPPGATRLRRGRQAAVASAARAGLDAALISLGLLAFWELRRYSAAPRLAGGRLGIDPVLALAPALALAGTALLPLRALPAAVRLLDRLSARSTSLAGALASWQVSRRPLRQGGPILLVVLAVATGTLVLAQHQSWRQSQLDQAAFATGADVRVSLAAPLPLGRAGRVADARGVRHAMPVSSFSSGFDVYALDARAAASTVLLRPDLSGLPVTELWQRITPGRAGPGLVLPGRPVRLAITAMLHAAPAVPLDALPASVTVQDSWGIAYSIAAGTLPADGRSHRLTADLATAGQAHYPLRLLTVALAYRLPEFPPPPYRSLAAMRTATRAEARAASSHATLAIGGLAASPRATGSFPAPFAGPSDLARWRATAASPDLSDPHAHGTPPAVTAWRRTAGAASLTFTVGSGDLVQLAGLAPQPITAELALAAGPPVLPVPGVATRAFLASAGAHLGGIVQLPVANIDVPVRLVAEIDAFPTAGGAGSALIVDQASLQDAVASQLQPPLPVTQWWLQTAGGGPAGLPAGSSVASPAAAAAGLLDDPLPNVPQLALLVIVAAAALLAGLGLAVSVVAAVRERRLQDALLSALGMGRGARTGQLCLEQLLLSGPAAVAGALIGAGLARLLVPAVTLTTAASAPFPAVRVVFPVGWTLLLALAVAVVPVLAAAAAAAYQPDPAAQLRAGETA
jgi:hypothetical protein